MQIRLFVLQKYPRHKKIRLGYVSGELREHANGSLMTGLIESHDKNKFEVTAFDNGYDDKSNLRQRLLKSFDEHIDIRQISDDDLIKDIRKKEIDILFDLNGFFGDSRL
jgi:predicted O-linked N-acetylglucosamine transferase (SPINDLY family)